MAFMGGWYAFPGGGWSKRDTDVPFAGQPQGVETSPVHAALPEGVLDGVELTPILPPGLVVSALRELFEETGLLLSLGPVQASILGAARDRLLANKVDFGSVVKKLKVRLEASRLVYAGRWLTPPFGPIRFDNRFFLLEWPETEEIQPVVIPGEAELGEWVDPAVAIKRWERGELITAPPILHILEVLAAEGPQGGLERLRSPNEANLGPYRRIEFRPGVLLFPQKTPTLPPAATTNAYVLGTRETILVDPGSPFEVEIERLIDSIEAQRLKLGRTVSAIWLTHHHPDHIGGVAAIRDALKVPILAHASTAERLQRAGIRVDGELFDNQIVALGGDPPFGVRILHTPGHARGHLCFFDTTFGSLIAGDLVAGFGTIVIDPPEGNMAAYLASLQRVLDLEPATLFPSHGPTIQNASAKLQEYLDHRRWREARILKIWQQGRREPGEMIEYVYDELPTLAIPLAERQVVAHLDHLREQGLLTD
jgi:glyoxylase-like metal-dependent hydrolase (beta-lactamase superfamily II)/8-oxo-dGTP pyrophosphatase MutT (NUDIX family)